MTLTTRFVALAAVGTACFLGGCAKSGDKTASTSGTDTAPATTDTRAAYKVVYIPKNTGNSYFDPVITGFEKAGKELGYDFTTVAPATADSTSQISFVKEQIQRGVNAIAISPNSPDALKSVLKEARSKGIKVITVDADVDGGTDVREATVLPVDFSIIGKSQIELMSSLIGGKGEFAILSATTDAPNQNAWIKGMKETLKDPKYKDMKLVDVVYGDDEPQKSQRETEALLTKYPNLKGIIAPTTVGVMAAAQALDTAQAAQRVQLTGLGMPNQMRAFLEKGTVKKVALWDPEAMGYTAGYIFDGLIKKGLKTAPGTTFKAGSLGEKKFGADGTVIAGVPLVFEKSNIAKYKF